MVRRKHVYLSLGSNLGRREANISTALAKLAGQGVEVVRVSSWYRTEPVGYTAQPWFLNCVVETATGLMPLQLLKRCQAIERELGRKHGTRNGPRPVDIDILLYDSVMIHSPELTIPHPRMAERRFVLVPLSEIAPDAEHPVMRQSMSQMLKETPDRSQVVRLKPEENEEQRNPDTDD
ncbi:MAG TPA: 2-amino-4-hydroxy-6-hydroxymethyldihydropteridine diphosphokinase [Terriglobia bacterium]